MKWSRRGSRPVQLASIGVTSSLLALAGVGVSAASPSIVEYPTEAGVVPYSVAVSHSPFAPGAVFVTDAAGGTLQERSAEDGSFSKIDLDPAAKPHGVAVDGDSVWVAGFGNSTLYRVKLANGSRTVDRFDLHQVPDSDLNDPNLALKPQGVLVSKDHSRVWVTLSGVDRVVALDATADKLDAAAVTDTVVTGTPDTQSVPANLAEGPDGRIWVSEQAEAHHGVAAITPRADDVEHYALPGSNALVFGIAATEDAILATAWGTDMVYEVGTDGQVGESPVKLPAGSRPRAIAVGQDSTGGSSSAWVLNEGSAGTAPNLARIDLRSHAVVDTVPLPTATGDPYSLTVDSATSTFWGTEFGGKQLFSFSHQDVLADQLTITAGDGGWALPGNTFAPKLAVTASANGKPVADVDVTFTVNGTAASFTDGASNTETVVATTDAHGVATVSEDLVANVGIPTTTTFQVTASAAPASPVAFTETVGVAATNFEATSPTSAYGHHGQVFTRSPEAKVTSGATALPDTPVTFTVAKSGVSFVPGPGATATTATVRTDADGVAHAPAVLAGDAEGTATIEASTPAYPGKKLAYTYTVTPPVATLTLDGSGNGNLAPGELGTATTTALDATGRPVVGERITAVLDNAPSGVIMGGGDPSGTLTLTTDGQGQIHWGAKGDGSDTWKVGETVSIGTQFRVVFHTADADGATASFAVTVNITRH